MKALVTLPCDFRGADLQNALLHGSELFGADLRSANFRDADLRNAQLYGAELNGAHLRNANLGGANLRFAGLVNADLRDADLSYTDLRGTNFGAASLYNANLCGVDLSDANLRSTDLRFACLSEADLQGVKIGNCIGNMKEIQSMRLFMYPVTWMWNKKEQEVELAIGCQQFLLPKWESRYIENRSQAYEEFGTADATLLYRSWNFLKTAISFHPVEQYSS